MPRCVDSLWLDYTKGLGAPVGASLAGYKDFIKEAWRQKQMLGGSMRQSGVIAAAALYALDHNWDRLAEDHDNARHLAEGIANIRGSRSTCRAWRPTSCSSRSGSRAGPPPAWSMPAASAASASAPTPPRASAP